MLGVTVFYISDVQHCYRLACIEVLPLRMMKQQSSCTSHMLGSGYIER
jgi:hypothetical protein